METITVETSVREQFVDVTRDVGDVVRSSGVRDGWALVFCPHTTAGVCINESADPDVARDVLASLGGLCPRDASWRHAEGNADAHAKAVLVGPSQTIPVQGGSLVLGTWQGVFFCEFDGPRRRDLLVSVAQA
jgi:secondary thiamine-phosphate synthase enzyme